jgi:hypothetical protein
MAVNGMRRVENRGSGEPMSYASREQNYGKSACARRAAPDRYLLIICFIDRTLSWPAATDGGARFIGIAHA